MPNKFTRCNSLAMFALVLSFIVPMSVLAADISVKGRVLNEAGPMAGAKVYAFRTYTDLEKGQNASAMVAADNQGVYELKLPKGSYFFVARGEAEGRRFYAYHGANPIKIGEDKLWLGLLANPENPPVEYADGSTGIEGTISYKGKPVDGAYVALYRPDSKNFKGLGVKTESAAANGNFKVSAIPGRYVVVAKKIQGGMSNRPLQKGDLYCNNSNNPVEVKDGKTVKVQLSCFPVTDRTAFATAPIIKDDDSKTFAERASSSISGIRGRVTDASGNPVANMSVLAYAINAPVTQMYFFAHGTEYSSITDEAGRFFIPIDEDGDYGLLARNILGDGPHRGETFGLYQGNSRYAISFKKGKIVENVNIVAGKVMQLPKDQEGKKPEIIVGTKVGAPVYLNDSVIASDTVWQGEIHITGVISIKRGATLTIRPGTVVKFKRIDRDNNKVGDGEIMVEGRIVAKGSSTQKITFTSAEEKPKVNDWSYIQLISSDPDNIFENCQFEYAYVGLMTHFANMRVVNCLFQNNGRGLHYTSTDMVVDHCTFINNNVGIYFTRLEGTVWITNNDIARNQVGVLFVKQHINVVDFDRSDQGTETPHMENNNIHDNHKYNFSLGEGQERDISAAGNWWGVAEKQAIGEAIYDGNNDKTLGKIVFEPFLKAPVANAGVKPESGKSHKQ